MAKSQFVNGHLRKPKNLAELREAFDSITSTTAGDVRFMAQAAMYVIEQRESPKTRTKSNSKPSPWQAFFAAGMKAGKSPREIGEDWRRKKGLRSA